MADRDLAALLQQAQLDQPPVRTRITAEGDDTPGAGTPGMAAHPLEMLAVAVEHGDAAGLQALEDLAFASAIASTDGKNSRCAGATVVISATCGRTWPVRARISPAWFMPSSNTP